MISLYDGDTLSDGGTFSYGFNLYLYAVGTGESNLNYTAETGTTYSLSTTGAVTVTF